MNHDASTNDPGLHTIPAQPPAPDSMTGNAAPFGKSSALSRRSGLLARTGATDSNSDIAANPRRVVDVGS